MRDMTPGSTVRRSTTTTAVLHRLGRAAVRRRRVTVVAWSLVAIGVIALAQTVGGSMSDTFEIPGTESQRALDVLEEDFPDAARALDSWAYAEGVRTTQRLSRRIVDGFVD
jgi:RND superfamily putative drug exporter